MRKSDKMFWGLAVISIPLSKFLDTNISQVAEFMSAPYLTGLLIGGVYGLLMIVSLTIGKWDK